MALGHYDGPRLRLGKLLLLTYTQIRQLLLRLHEQFVIAALLLDVVLGERLTGPLHLFHSRRERHHFRQDALLGSP